MVLNYSLLECRRRLYHSQFCFMQSRLQDDLLSLSFLRAFLHSNQLPVSNFLLQVSIFFILQLPVINISLRLHVNHIIPHHLTHLGVQLDDKKLLVLAFIVKKTQLGEYLHAEKSLRKIISTIYCELPLKVLHIFYWGKKINNWINKVIKKLKKVWPVNFIVILHHPYNKIYFQKQYFMSFYWFSLLITPFNYKQIN